MAGKPTTEPITVRAAPELIAALDMLAEATDRSRNYLVIQALQQYVVTNSWQVAQALEGIAAADAGEVEDADEVFGAIAARQGWPGR